LNSLGAEKILRETFIKVFPHDDAPFSVRASFPF